MTWANSTDGIDTTLVTAYTNFNVGTVYDFSAGSIVTVDIDANNDGFTTDGETSIVDGVTTADSTSINNAVLDGLVTYSDGTTSNATNLIADVTADGQIIWYTANSGANNDTTGIDSTKNIVSFQITSADTTGFASTGNYGRMFALTNVDLSPSPDGVVEGTGDDDLIDASYLGILKATWSITWMRQMALVLRDRTRIALLLAQATIPPIDGNFSRDIHCSFA